MKRSTFKRRGAVPTWKRPRKPKPAIPKATGARVDGGKLAHRKSTAHLALVRAQPCLVSRRLGPGVVAHHAQECFPEQTQTGSKVSDFLAVPLAHEFHDPGHPGSLHQSNSASWWEEHGIRPLEWLLHFLKRHYKPGENEGASEAIGMVRRRIDMNGQ